MPVSDFFAVPVSYSDIKPVGFFVHNVYSARFSPALPFFVAYVPHPASLPEPSPEHEARLLFYQIAQFFYFRAFFRPYMLFKYFFLFGLFRLFFRGFFIFLCIVLVCYFFIVHMPCVLVVLVFMLFSVRMFCMHLFRGLFFRMFQLFFFRHYSARPRFFLTKKIPSWKTLLPFEFTFVFPSMFAAVCSTASLSNPLTKISFPFASTLAPWRIFAILGSFSPRKLFISTVLPFTTTLIGKWLYTTRRWYSNPPFESPFIMFWMCLSKEF